MELSCPSCSVKHRTEDHVGAFEILCVCGYSILVPDEAAFAEPAPVTSHASRVPTTLDAEDSELAIPAPEPEAAPAAFEMTPPEELPDGMVYDPFEVSEMGAATETPAIVAPPTENFTPPTETAGLGFESIVPEASFEAPAATPTKAPAAAPAAPRAAVGQKIVERVQAASLGRLLGHSYELRCEGLDRERLVEIANRCEALVKARPWLESELRNRGLVLSALADDTKLANVPEVVALEVYLACYELGGTCSLERSP